MKKFIRIVSVIALVFVMTVIFIFSSQNAVASKSTSTGFTAKIISFFYPEFAKMSIDKQNEIIDNLPISVRKCAHFTLYFCLGACAYCTLVTYKKVKKPLKIILPAVFCVLYALSDEFHQTFVKGRSGELRDVLIDSVAAIIAVAVMSLVFSLKKVKKIIN